MMPLSSSDPVGNLYQCPKRIVFCNDGLVVKSSF